ANIGYVHASRIYADSLSAVSANLGTIITLKDPSKPNGARRVIQGAVTRVYDDNNVLRMIDGYWD
ncbi:MAG: hypothetical protein L0G98_13555, partial [Acinetobacter sp.]|nr:hypothetical protein [Acinetobacter sp.]